MKCIKVIDKLYLVSGNIGEDLGDHRKILSKEDTRNREGSSSRVSNWQNGTLNILDSQENVSHLHLRTFVGDIQRREVTFAGTLLTWEEVVLQIFYF